MALALGLASGCMVTRRQRTGLVVGGAVVTAATAVWAVSFMLQECPSAGAGSSVDCEADRVDNRNKVAAVSLVALGATIFAQLLPVSDPEKPPPPPPLVLAPPARLPAGAAGLHDPAVLALIENARTQAAAGRCAESYGSLKALESLDAPLAAQLRSTDPLIGRCRKASEVSVDGALEVGASGPPGATTP